MSQGELIPMELHCGLDLACRHLRSVGAWFLGVEQHLALGTSRKGVHLLEVGTQAGRESRQDSKSSTAPKAELRVGLITTDNQGSYVE